MAALQAIPYTTHDDARSSTAIVVRGSRTRTAAGLIASDMLGWAVAAALAYAAAALFGTALETADLLLGLVGLVLAPVAYGGVGLYPAAGVSGSDEFRRLTFATSGVWLVLVASVALGRGFAEVGPLVGTWLVALASVPFARAVFRLNFGGRPWYGVPVVVFGAGKAGSFLIRRMKMFRYGFRPVAIFDDDPQRHGTRVQGVPVVGSLDAATAYAALGVRHVVIAMPSLRYERVTEIVRGSARPFPNVILLPEFTGVASVGISTRNLGGLAGLHVRQELLRRRNMVMKRALDLLVLLPIALVSAPIVAIAALAVWRASPGNPFYAQEREGYGGRTFRMWKLRTMYLDASDRLERHLAADPEAAAEWATRFKLADDPRILPGIGRFLRKTSLDELPQIWNVLRGEMSLVGPRPFPRYHLDAFGATFRTLRSEVRPGITGLWQVTARADSNLALQEELDTLYVSNWSMWLDFYLLARTPWAVLNGRGAI